MIGNSSNYYEKQLAPSMKWHLWAGVYMLMVFALTWIEAEVSILVIAMYFALALPFAMKPELYLAICVFFSLISYYFCGADEGIYSMYTILLVLSGLNGLILRRKVGFSLLLTLFGGVLLALAVDSYRHSPLHYANGLYILWYVIVAAIAVAMFMRPERGDIDKYWPGFAASFFLLCLVSCVLTGGGELGRFSIHPDINYNTFGLAMSQLGVVFSVKYFILDARKNPIYLGLWLMAMVMVLLSGSRSALLASIGAFLIIQVLHSRRQGKATQVGLLLLLGGVIVLFAVVPFMDFMGFDFSRFSIQDVIDTGASNRRELWQTLIPEVVRNYKEYGLGPGHYCTAVLIKELLFVDYSHAHNLLLESFCELGTRGLVVFTLLLIVTLAKGAKATKNDKNAYIPYACFIALMINGIGEAYFCDIILWLLIGILFSFRTRAEKVRKEKMKR